MVWIFILLIVIFIFYAYLKTHENNQLKESLKDNEFRKSYIQDFIEEGFQNYLKLDLQTISNFRKKLAEAKQSNNEGEIKKIKSQIKFFTDEVTAFKRIKKELQMKDRPIWNHTDFSDEGINELKEKISDCFSSAASAAFLRIR